MEAEASAQDTSLPLHSSAVVQFMTSLKAGL